MSQGLQRREDRKQSIADRGNVPPIPQCWIRMISIARAFTRAHSLLPAIGIWTCQSNIHSGPMRRRGITEVAKRRRFAQNPAHPSARSFLVSDAILFSQARAGPVTGHRERPAWDASRRRVSHGRLRVGAARDTGARASLVAAATSNRAPPP